MMERADTMTCSDAPCGRQGEHKRTVFPNHSQALGNDLSWLDNASSKVVHVIGKL